MAIPSRWVRDLATPKGRIERQLLTVDEYGPHSQRADTMKYIEIKEYKNKVGDDGKVQWIAVGKDKKEYPMPEQFAAMYNEKYLAIRKVRYEMAEVLNLPAEEIYIPLRTDMS